MISDINGSLWSRQFLNVANKRTCFASCALPMFLSRLNEISGGCEKITPVSGSF